MSMVSISRTLCVPSVLAGALLVAPAVASPFDGECLPKATLPLPLCLPAANDEERMELLIRRAGGLLESQQWATAQRLLTEQLPQLQHKGNLGLRVQAYTLLGEASMLDGKREDATRSFETAVSLWSDVTALSWIQSLPKGEASQRAVRDATNAAANAVFRLADLWCEQHAVPFPKFIAPQFETYANEGSASATPAERKRSTAERQRFQAAVQEYLQKDVVPWYVHQSTFLEAARRKYEQVLLVPPAVPPYFRIAVAERIGSLWGRFVQALHYVGPKEHEPPSEARTWSGITSGDEPSESLEEYAHSAMDTCVQLSRKYRIVSPHTLSCENWLADHFRIEHQRFDELMPRPDWLPEMPLLGEPPATLENLTQRAVESPSPLVASKR
ncbi:MAG: hypothetical protein QM784_21640 [Polyangiaceae bacterium]